MQKIVHAGVAGACLLIVAACGDGTAPQPALTGPQIARHFDSLWVKTTNATRASFLSTAVLAPALGASPVNVTIGTRTGTYHWQGFLWFCDLAQGCGGDSTYVLIAYSDYSLTTALLAGLQFEAEPYSPTPYQWVQSVSLLSNDSVMVTGGSGTVAMRTTSMGSHCVAVPGAVSVFSDWVSNCNLATFQGSVSWSFPTPPPGNADLQEITIAPQVFDGVYVQ
jgi:hypothetical protein